MLYLKAVILNFDHKVPLLEKNNKTAHTNGELIVYSENLLWISWALVNEVAVALVKIKRQMSLNNKPASSESTEFIEVSLAEVNP